MRSAADEVLADQQHVTATEVLGRLGWLHASHLDRWRQGLLVEERALEEAERSCLHDAAARARRRERDRERRHAQDLDLEERMATAIGRQLPGCPRDRAEAIARHTATRGSGRVGRSAAGASSTPPRWSWPSRPWCATRTPPTTSC